MAVLSSTRVTKHLQVAGGRVIAVFTIAAIGTGAANEWIATGLKRLDACLGVVCLGTAGGASTPNVVLNAQGTGVAAGTNNGDLGIECIDAGTNTWMVTVLGRL